MEDWIARAIKSAKYHIQKDAAVAKDALRCSRWIASSALQKAIRRGDIALAQHAAFALHRENGPATWRRLIAIAFEDIGPADVDVVLETVAVATSPDGHGVSGKEPVLCSIVSRLASAPKDRSADYLMWVAAEHPDRRETRAVCGQAWTIRDRFTTALWPRGCAQASITRTSIASAPATSPG
jgi:replication-associated recombination protein RarA